MVLSEVSPDAHHGPTRWRVRVNPCQDHPAGQRLARMRATISGESSLGMGTERLYCAIFHSPSMKRSTPVPRHSPYSSLSSASSNEAIPFSLTSMWRLPARTVNSSAALLRSMDGHTREILAPSSAPFRRFRAVSRQARTTRSTALLPRSMHCGGTRPALMRPP